MFKISYLIFVFIVIEITNSSGRSVFIPQPLARTHNLIIIRNKHTQQEPVCVTLRENLFPYNMPTENEEKENEKV
jgi:hypothetical protein